MPEVDFKLANKKLEEMGEFLRKQFNETEKRRENFKETEWLESTRQFKGIYDPEVLAKIDQNRSRVYPRYTRSKVQPAVAKLNNMLFPDNDRNWEIRPTPEPRLTPDQIEEIVQSLAVPDDSGDIPEPTQEDIDAAILSYSKEKAARMARIMDDQLVEMNYPTEAKAAIRSGVMLGTGVLKGPLVKSKMSRKMQKVGDVYEQVEEKMYHPDVEYVRLWNWFPDMSATELRHCNFVYELNSMTKHEVRKLSKLKNFKKKVIEDYLNTHKDGDYRIRNWEQDLKTLKDEEDTQNVSKNFEVLELNGFLDGHDLAEIGVLDAEKDDIDRDWFINAWILGDKIIKITKHKIESLEEFYHVFYFEKDDSSIFGEGIPRIIRDTQIAICSATRAMLDNAAWVAGPIFENNADLLADDEDPDDVYPGRVFQREGRGSDAQYPAIRVHNIDSRMNDYLGIINKFERNGDMESTLPAFLFGEAAKTTNETSKGISIRESNTNLTINDIVKQFDEANESFLRALYAWNMKYHKDDTAKGDMEIKAIGSSSLVSKEVRTQNLELLAQTLTEEDMPYIKRHKFLEERLKLQDLGPLNIMASEKEAREEIARRTDSEERKLALEKLSAENRYENAKAANMEAKAEATTHGMSLDELERLSNTVEKLKGMARGEKGSAPTPQGE